MYDIYKDIKTIVGTCLDDDAVGNIKEITMETIAKMKHPKLFVQEVIANAKANKLQIAEKGAEAGSSAFKGDWYTFGLDLGTINKILVFGTNSTNQLVVKLQFEPKDAAAIFEGWMTGYFQEPKIKTGIDCVSAEGLFDALVKEYEALSNEDWNEAVSSLFEVFSKTAEARDQCYDENVFNDIKE